MRRRRWLRRKIRERMSVITHESTTFSGLLVSSDDEGVVLTGVTFYAEDGTPQVLSGEIMVPRSNVAFVQHEPLRVGPNGP